MNERYRKIILERLEYKIKESSNKIYLDLIRQHPDATNTFKRNLKRASIRIAKRIIKEELLANIKKLAREIPPLATSSDKDKYDSYDKLLTIINGNIPKFNIQRKWIPFPIYLNTPIDILYLIHYELSEIKSDIEYEEWSYEQQRKERAERDEIERVDYLKSIGYNSPCMHCNKWTEDIVHTYHQDDVVLCRSCFDIPGIMNITQRKLLAMEMKPP